MIVIEGYNKITEMLEATFPIPEQYAEIVKNISDVVSDDPEVVFCYPLTAEQLNNIKEQTKISFDVNQYEYFLTSYDD